MALSDPRRRNPRTVLNHEGGSYPACFNSSTDYTQWLYLLRLSNQHLRIGFCVDCTHQYKLEMLSEGRCAHPETKFAVLRNKKDPSEVEIIGVSSKSVYWARVDDGKTIIDGAKDGQD
jgi:hypothetical protein